MPEKEDKNSVPEANAGEKDSAAETQEQVEVEPAAADNDSVAITEDSSDSQTESSSSPTNVPEEADDAQIPALPDFTGMLSEAAAGSIELLNDVELNVKIELGRAEMTVDEILHLASGSVVELDKLAGDPVDILVNEQLIARGEILVVNDNFCVRVNEIVPGISKQGTSESSELEIGAEAPTPGHKTA